MNDLNARISQLEADLAGANFAAQQHLNTVEAQAKQIAELTACVAAYQRSLIDHAKRQDADLVDPALRGPVLAIQSGELAELRKLAMAAATGNWTARVDEVVTLRDAADNQLAIFTHINTRTGGRRDADQVAATGRFCAAANPAAILRLLDMLAATPAQPIAAPHLPTHVSVRMYDEVAAALEASETELAALKAPAQPIADVSAPTDLSKRLREAATADVGIAQAKLLIGAADEIERYYGGMMAWKKTAEKKDADWNAERMGRVDDRIAARTGAPTDAEIAASVDEYDALRTAIITALGEHRMVHLHEMEDDGPGAKYPLVDQLSLDGGTIGSGKDEIEAIADAVLDVLSARAAAPVSGPSIERVLSKRDVRIITRAVRYLAENGCSGPAADLKSLLETAAPVSGPSDGSFVAYAKQAGLDLSPAKDMECEHGEYPATYWFSTTEAAWRAWANKPSAAPVSGPTTERALKLLNDIALWWHADRLEVVNGNPAVFEALMESVELFMHRAKRAAPIQAPTEQPDANGDLPSDDFHLPLMCLIENYMAAVDYHGSQKGEKCDAAEEAIRAALIKLAAPVSGQGASDLPPLPDAIAWRYKPKDGLPHPAYTEREAQAIAYDEQPVALVTLDQLRAYGQLCIDSRPRSEDSRAKVPGFALVPLKMTRAMIDATEEEGWQWEDLLAAAEAITEEKYNALASIAAPTGITAIEHGTLKREAFVSDAAYGLYVGERGARERSGEVAPFAWIIVRDSNGEHDGGTPMTDKDEADDYMENSCLPGWHLEPIFRAAPAAPQAPARELTDAAMLDFVLENDAFLSRRSTDAGGTSYQLVTQNEDEEYIELSGDDKFFPSALAAVRAAIERHLAATPATADTKGEGE